jgi:putative ABC transport system ATP-binding protein
MEGEVLINGTSLYALKGNALDKFRGKNIGIVFQKPHIISALSVVENLRLAHFFAGSDNLKLVDTYMAELGITDKKNASVHTLSEGEAQRVSIARALVNGPKVILADEPTASLDDENAQTVIQLLQSQARKLNAVLVIVTHDQRVKAHISNRITVGGPL